MSTYTFILATTTSTTTKTTDKMQPTDEQQKYEGRSADEVRVLQAWSGLKGLLGISKKHKKCKSQKPNNGDAELVLDAESNSRDVEQQDIELEPYANECEHGLPQDIGTAIAYPPQTYQRSGREDTFSTTVRRSKTVAEPSSSSARTRSRAATETSTVRPGASSFKTALEAMPLRPDSRLTTLSGPSTLSLESNSRLVNSATSVSSSGHSNVLMEACFPSSRSQQRAVPVANSASTNSASYTSNEATPTSRYRRSNVVTQQYPLHRASRVKNLMEQLRPQKQNDNFTLADNIRKRGYKEGWENAWRVINMEGWTKGCQYCAPQQSANTSTQQSGVVTDPDRVREISESHRIRHLRETFAPDLAHQIDPMKEERTLSVTGSSSGPMTATPYVNGVPAMPASLPPSPGERGLVHRIPPNVVRKKQWTPYNTIDGGYSRVV